MKGGILIYAPASKDNRNPSFCSASVNDVFCIFSTDGRLGTSAFNPPPNPSEDNFAILGESVKVPSSEFRVSGTSVSAAIAAGIAAGLLDFARQPDARTIIDSRAFETMKTKAGMAAIFRLMWDHRGSGHQCLAPWNLLPFDHATKNRETIREEICRKFLKALQKIRV